MRVAYVLRAQVLFLFLGAAHLASQVNEPQVPLARAGEGEVETEWTKQGLPPEFAGESTIGNNCRLFD